MIELLKLVNFNPKNIYFESKVKSNESKNQTKFVEIEIILFWNVNNLLKVAC